MTPTPHHEKAAAEIVGALILISIFCVVIAIIAVAIFSTPPPEEVVSLNMQFAADPVTNTITIQHTGGDTIPAGEYQVLVGGVDVTQYVSSSGTSGSWAIGDTLTVYDPYIVVSPDTRVDVVYKKGGKGTYLLATNGTVGSVVSGGPPVPDFSYSVRPNTLIVDFTDLTAGGTRPLTYDWDFGNGTAHSSSQNPTETYGWEGIYSVTLSVHNSSDSYWVNVTKPVNIPHPVPPAPVASFSGSNTSGYAPLVVRFTDSSSGTPTNWSWTFGDGNTSLLQNPLNIYQVTGTYSVSLNATNEGGSNTATYTNYITVNPAPLPVVANFTGTPLSGSVPLIVQFNDTSTGPVTSWSWTFGDGNTSAEQNPLNTYFSLGSYTVSLMVGNGTGFNTLTRTNYVTVNPVRYNINVTAGPNGAITPGNTTVNASDNSPVFTITNTTVGYHIADVLIDGVSNGTIPSYQFMNVQADHTISATFAINTYNINVTAGPNGAITPGNTTVNYGDNSPMFTITNTTLGYHIANVLVDGVSNDTIPSYQFTNVVANHTLSATFSINTYTINVTAGPHGSIWPGNETVTHGGSSSHTYMITPDTGYHIYNTTVNGVVGNVTEYQFTNVVANSTLSATFAINMFTINATSGPNGNVTPAGVTVVDYGTNRSYNITPNTGYLVENVTVDGSLVGPVTMYNFTDVVMSHTIHATFAKPPIANFTASPIAGPVPLTVNFTDLSENSPTSWTWNFGYAGAPISHVQNPTYTYPESGNYSVMMWATNSVGTNLSIKEGYIFVYTPVVANFTADKTYGPITLDVAFTDTSTGGPITWYWQFIDPTIPNTSSVQNPHRSYATIGNFSVNLTVTNPYSSSYMFRANYINTTAAPPVSRISTNVSSGPAPLAVFFRDISSGSPTIWLWDFADGNTSTTKNVNYTFITPGNYNVNHTVTNSGGSNSSYKLINVYEVPTVSSVTPATGITAGGTTVTIIGTNFIGATAASIGGNTTTGLSVVNYTAITATTPFHAAAGTVDVVVTTPNGTATGTNAYTYVALPAFVSIVPSTGLKEGGTPVTITGTNLIGATTSGIYNVSIGGTTLTNMTVVSDTKIVGSTPAHAAGTVDVVITTPNGTATGTNAYTYSAAFPVFGSIVPSTGLIAGGTPVTITGTNLTGATTSGIYNVSIGGTALTNMTVVSDTKIVGSTPAHAAGTVDVVITTPNGTATGTNAYTYYVTFPTFGSIVPLSGPTTGGTPITITGTNLTGATTSGIYNVSIGGTALTNMTVVSSTTIVGSTPVHSAGAVDVVITTPNGTATGTNAYVYGAPPTIAGISPSSGVLAAGTRVTITGTNLVGATLVTFGSNDASIKTNTATVINTTAPAGSSPVTVTVTVRTPNGTVTTSYDYFTIRIFNASTTWAVPTNTSAVEYLVVAGGGGGGRIGGGGGAGGVLTGTLTTGLSGNLNVRIGAGGVGATSNSVRGGNGTNSSFANTTLGNGINARGGGGGGSYNTAATRSGGYGGSGGGGTRAAAGGPNVTGQGFAGGAGYTTGTTYIGGGGGGKGSYGLAGSSSGGGAGGAGLDSSLSGTSLTYACGGGGGSPSGGSRTAGAAGCSIAGAGGLGAAGTSATANFGGGGGGAGSNVAGGVGGSGVVVIKYY